MHSRLQDLVAALAAMKAGCRAVLASIWARLDEDDRLFKAVVLAVGLLPFLFGLLMAFAK
jgi:hypothetical protein